MSDDAFDAAGAKGEANLAKLLGNDSGGGVGVEEAMPNDLANHFVGASRGAFGSAFLTEECGGAEVAVGLAQLEIALFAEAELARCGGGSESLTFAFDEHGEFAGDFIVGSESEGAGGADKELLLQIDVEHG